MSQYYGSGDTYLIEDFVDDDLFDKVKAEIKWYTMCNRNTPVPRLVSLHGTINDSVVPIYRHPAEEQPELVEWTESTAQIKHEVEKRLQQKINHSLNQYYRTSLDNIGEHSDKTLDIEHGTNILNYSLGAMRTMLLKSKTKDANGQLEIQRIKLPHNSLLVMGLKTNKEWYHSIKQDRRDDREKSAEELAYNQERISLTMRTIATFLDKKTGVLFGQGAPKEKGSSVGDANTTTDAPTEATADATAMVIAFSKENHDPLFDWEENYGCGFSVLDFKSLPTV